MIEKIKLSCSEYKQIILKKLEISESKEIKKNKEFLSNFNIEYFANNDESVILNDLKIIKNIKEENKKIDIDLVFTEDLKKKTDNSENFQPNQSHEKENEKIFFKIYINQKENEKILISDLILTIESFFLKIISIDHYENCQDNQEKIIIYSFEVHGFEQNSELKNNPEKKKNFFNVFFWLFEQGAKNSISNCLSLKFGIDLRQIKLLDGIFAYFKQIHGPFDHIFVKTLINQNPEIFFLFLDFFNARLNPKKNNLNKILEIKQKIFSSIDAIKNINEFHLIKKIFEIFEAISRTNFFQNKSWISFKFKSSLINGIKKEGVFAEIFVFSENVEGIHLRGGRIARGGFRMSDRIQDYRTEAFDLMKAQIKKNSIITPTGAKACFIIKNLEKNQKKTNYLTESYQTFIRGLLDITDNLDPSGNLIVPENITFPKDLPKHILAQEEKDCFIVAAADKGTARFSDAANSISAEYNFWLGDAFASGGSNGYDHKGLAITSRGVWISVQKLFSEINKNIEKEGVSIVGIGGMTGDVFGNGMLMSKKIKLIAAFDHLNIFIDPNPDEESSYLERKRLFDLKGVTWNDYNKSLISEGGGIFDRSAKLVKISLNAAKALGVLNLSNLEFTTDELIKIILKAKVDMIFNGGIGTFVKSSLESNEDALDRDNDQIRINGCDLRVFVVAEAGNLGLTQKGRVEFSRLGGRFLNNSNTHKKIAKINTDFIDNSAGVSCSDREVNIKIALQKALMNKKITMLERNKLLKDMEKEVCELVLKDNLLQNNALMIEEFRSKKNISWHMYLIRKLEKSKILHREFESLPLDEEISKLCNAGESLTRPELCILLSYSKIWLKTEILNSKISENPYFEKFLIGYFPSQMNSNFRDEIISHPLRKEIITNYIVNTIVNRIGINFILNLMEKSGTSIEDIVYAYFIIRDSYGLRQIWHNVEYEYDLPNNNAKILAFLEIKKYATYIISRFLRVPGYNLSELSQNIKELGEKISYSIENFENLIPKKSFQYYQKKCTEYKKYISEEACFSLLAKISGLIFIPSIIHIARKKGSDFDTLVKIYFLIEEKLESRALRKHISQFVSSGGLYQEVSISILIDDISTEHSNILEFVIEKYKCEQEISCHEKLISSWSKDFASLIENYSKIKIKNLELKEFDYSFLILLLNRIKLLHN